MLNRIDLTQTLSAIRSASALTEVTFLQIGKALEASMDILSHLASSFEAALGELRDEKLGKALDSLGGAAVQVTGLGRNQSAASARFGEMQRLAEAISERIAKMNRSIRGVDSLAINSKIAAASIRGSAIDFTTFASEIARTLRMTQASLDDFASELQIVRNRLESAHARQLLFEKDQKEAIHSIPKRLNATARSMPIQQRRNAQGIAGVEQRGERIRHQVRSAISALQVGDMTRQRLEHADYALTLLADVHGLAEEEQRAFSMTTCRLESAQLSATADEFDHNVRQITASLGTIASEARRLRNLGGSTYGSTESEKGTFIGDLEAQISAALSLFEDYGMARAEAAETMTSVSAAAEGLCKHLRTVQSLEDDIRIMGLNTTLQCARVGPEGRALGLIAQELRSYGNQFAREASALIKEVENLTNISGSFGAGEADEAALVATVMQAMKDSLSSIRQVGHTLDATMSTLERDSERVVNLLEASAADLVANDGIGEALRRTAGVLQAVAPPDAPPVLDLPPRALQMLDKIANSYTMATERVIHERILGRSGSAPEVKVEPAKAELEDMLF